MKNRVILSLTELLVMLLLFAIAAAMCLQIFAASGRLSRQAEQRDRAVLVAQSLAECWKADRLPAAEVFLDADWGETDGEAAYRARVRETEETPWLSRAEITVTEVDSGRCIFTLETARQEAVR